MTRSSFDPTIGEPVVPAPRSITVVIPTHKRPNFLRSALESVRNQSRLDLIAEVVVSENGEDPRSEVVCREFQDLPVRFVRQSPPIEVGQHFALLPTLGVTPLIALLGDDDMWGRYHLEEAARQLSSHPGAVAFIGSAVIVQNQSRCVSSPYSPLVESCLPPWSDRFADHWVWGPREMLLASLPLTPFNMWAVVARRGVLLAASEVFNDAEMGIDSDRFMIWRLACLGSVVIGREVSLYYRVHEGSGCARMAAEAPDWHRRKSRLYTERMLAEAASLGIDARKEWVGMLASMTPEQRRFLGKCFYLAGSCDALQAAWGDGCGLPAPLPPSLGALRSVARRLLPPGIVRHIEAWGRRALAMVRPNRS